MLIIYKFILKDWIQAVSVLSLTLTFYIAAFTVFWYTQKGSSGNGMHSPYHSSRAIGLSAAQLYSHLDEEKSGSKRWAGQHSPALYVIKQMGRPRKLLAEHEIGVSTAGSGRQFEILYAFSLGAALP